jgi:NAD(P)-dependent dehydrogenase (short-subunit alcohol dehydrogenase family)
VTADRGDARTRDLAGRGHPGEICARDFAEHGAHVVLVDSDEAALDALCAEIRAAGGQATGIVADAADPDDLVRAAEECRRARGGADVLLTCHSDLELASIEHSSVESWRRVVDFDLLGAVFAAKAFLPLLKEAQDAAIVHVGSIDGTLGNPQVPSYSAAKGGLVPLTHVMADEFAGHGIRVNCVARAMIVDRGAPLHPMFDRLVEHTPLGRPAYKDEVGAVVRFLASPESSYVSGAVLPVDGGRTGVTPGTSPR